MDELSVNQVIKLPTYVNPDKPGYSYIVASEWDHSQPRCAGCEFATGPMHGHCQNYGAPHTLVGNCGSIGHHGTLAGAGMRSDHRNVIFRKVGDHHSDKILGVSPTSEIHIGTMILGDAVNWYKKKNKFSKEFALRFFTKEQLESYDTDHRHYWDEGYSAMHIDEAKTLFNSKTQIRKKAVNYFFTQTELFYFG